MKLKKLLVGTLSTAMLISALSVSAVAEEDTKYATGFISWADGIASYYWGDEDKAGVEILPKIDIVGNGTYTINTKVYNAAIDEDSGEEIGGPVKGLAVLAVDLKLIDEKAEWADLYPDARIELEKVEIGGENIEYDLSKLKETASWDETKELSGGTNILESATVLRQNIYNSWGLGGGAFEPDAEKEYETISVTFKVSGLTDAPDVDDQVNAELPDVAPATEAPAETEAQTTEAKTDSTTSNTSSSDTSKADEDEDSKSVLPWVIGGVVVAAVIVAGVIIGVKKKNS